MKKYQVLLFGIYFSYFKNCNDDAYLVKVNQLQFSCDFILKQIYVSINNYG